MKDDKTESADHTEQDMLRVLQAERDAVHSIHNCENDALQILSDAQDTVQSIQARTDQRISDMEMRHAHKLNRMVTSIEKQGAAELRHDAGLHYDSETMQVVIEDLAIELSTGNVVSVEHIDTEEKVDR